MKSGSEQFLYFMQSLMVHITTYRLTQCQSRLKNHTRLTQCQSRFKNQLYVLNKNRYELQH